MTRSQIRWIVVTAAVVVGLALLLALFNAFQPGVRSGYAVPDGGTVVAPAGTTLVAFTPTITPSPAAPTFTGTPTLVPTDTPAPTLPPTQPPTETPAPLATATGGLATTTPAITDQAATPSVGGTPGATPTLTPTPVPPETPQPSAWTLRKTAHYDLYYLPGGRAAREIDTLATLAEKAMQGAAAALGVAPNARVRIYFVNRIFWQGGAAYPGNQLLLSYADADRDYTVTSVARVLQHETTHALVGQMPNIADHVGGLLGEGVAVWAAGGHYQIESVTTLAATLADDNRDLYIPLSDLRRDFYSAQHEIAYLEGAAYDSWLIQTWGLPKFKQYLTQPDNPQPIYSFDSAALETQWLAWLADQPHTAADSRAVRLRVRYYDLMRRYESTRDPDARLLPGPPPGDWGPSLVRIFSRPATAPANVALEREMVRAGTALWQHDLDTCARLLDDIAAQLP